MSRVVWGEVMGEVMGEAVEDEEGVVKEGEEGNS